MSSFVALAIVALIIGAGIVYLASGGPGRLDE
jgi:hypothetical protein